VDLPRLVTYYTLFVLNPKSRRVQIVGSTPNPEAAFMAQAARRFTDAVDGFLTGHRVLICDRDGSGRTDSGASSRQQECASS
jgi:putative transposase